MGFPEQRRRPESGTQTRIQFGQDCEPCVVGERTTEAQAVWSFRRTKTGGVDGVTLEDGRNIVIDANTVFAVYGARHSLNTMCSNKPLEEVIEVVSRGKVVINYDLVNPRPDVLTNATPIARLITLVSAQTSV